MAGKCNSKRCERPAAAVFTEELSIFPTRVLVTYELCDGHAELYGNAGLQPKFRYEASKSTALRKDGKRVMVKGRPRLTNDELRALVRSSIASHKHLSAKDLHEQLRSEGFAVDKGRVSTIWQQEWTTRGWMS